MSLISEFPFTGNVLLRFESDLRKQQSELRRVIDNTHKEILALAESEPGDAIDASCGNSSKEALFATYSQNRTELRRVGAALNRIAMGDFGICAGCGGAIGLNRLRALPWASNCIECQERSEQGVECIDREPVAPAFLKRWELPDVEAGA
jgi:RNA polymerase-binding transcription factor